MITEEAMKDAISAAAKMQRGRSISLNERNGLRFVADKSGARGTFRFVSFVTGKRRDYGIGSLKSLSLEQARKRAAQLVTEHRETGRDPIETRRLNVIQQRKEIAAAKLFEKREATRKRRELRQMVEQRLREKDAIWRGGAPQRGRRVLSELSGDPNARG